MFSSLNVWRVWCLALCGMCACFSEHVVDHTRPEDVSAGTDQGGVDASPSGALVDVTPLHDGLLVDGEVHRGEYEDGTPYEGINGASVRVDLSGHPTWKLALWHAALITREGDVGQDADTILSAAIVSSTLECEEQGRCFGLESGVHWEPLTRFFPDRFPAGERASRAFESSALIYAYYQRFSLALWVKDTPQPAAWLARHEDPTFAYQALYIAHVWSPWWEGFKVMFSSCQAISAPDCVTGQTNEPRYIQDQLGALRAVREALATRARRVEVAMTREHVQRYLDEIAWLFPDRDEQQLQSTLDERFASGEEIRDAAQVVALLERLHAHLSPGRDEGWMREALCVGRVLDEAICP